MAAERRSRRDRRVRRRRTGVVRPVGPPEWPYVVVDTCRVLLVDPCHLPPGVVRALVADRVAVLVEDFADGPAFVRILDDGRLVLTATCEGWTVVDPADADIIDLADGGD